jgi:hypothetical protein
LAALPSMVIFSGTPWRRLITPSCRRRPRSPTAEGRV